MAIDDGNDDDRLSIDEKLSIKEGHNESVDGDDGYGNTNNWKSDIGRYDSSSSKSGDSSGTNSHMNGYELDTCSSATQMLHNTFEDRSCSSSKKTPSGISAVVSAANSRANINPATQVKIIVYNLRNRPQKNLYVKFYHNKKKHKTSVCTDKHNVQWNEWFPITHSVGSNSPVLTIELWSSGFTRHKIVGSFQLDLTYVLEGEILDDYYNFANNAKGELRVRLLLVGPSLTEILMSIDLTPAQTQIADEIKLMFPTASYHKIMNSLQCHEYQKDRTVQYLHSLPDGYLARSDGNTNRARGMHLSPDKREECVTAIKDMVPDATMELIQEALSANEYDLSRTIDFLATPPADLSVAGVRLKGSSRGGFETDSPGSNSSTPAYSLKKIESLASTGGFVAQTDRRTGEERILHQSVLRQGCSGIGPETFRGRISTFEDSKKTKRKKMRLPVQLPTGEFA